MWSLQMEALAQSLHDTRRIGVRLSFLCELPAPCLEPTPIILPEVAVIHEKRQIRVWKRPIGDVLYGCQ
jgi:hypothetical protein